MKKVIVLYGPLGVGKLTVAKELSKETNFKVFHSHLLSDMLSEFFNTGTRDLADSFRDLWLYLFKGLLKSNNKGVIITLVYGVQTFKGKEDNTFFFQIKKIGEENKAKVIFVKLECSNEELKKRVQSNDRKKYKKVTDVSVLENIRRKYKVDEKAPFVESIVVNTTNLISKQTVKKIIKSLKII